MVTDAVKKYRDVLAYGLLAIAALYLISGLSLLFKSEEDTGGAGFADRAGIFGHLFAHPLLVVSLAGAVALAVAMGEPSRQARTIVMVALALGGLAALLALVSWFSSFGADSDFEVFGGVYGAGKIVSILLGLAQLLALGLTLLFAYSVLSHLPRTSRAAAGGWGNSGGGWPQQQQWGPPGAAGSWGGQGDGGYGAPAGYTGSGWGAPGQGAPAAEYGQPSWGQGPSYAGGASAAGGSEHQAGGWEAPSSGQRPWEGSAGGWGGAPEQQSGWGAPASPPPGASSRPSSDPAWAPPPPEPQPSPGTPPEVSGEHPDEERRGGEHRDDRRHDDPSSSSGGWWQSSSS